MSGLVTDAVLMQRRRRSLRAQRSACGADDFHMGRFPAVRMGRLARFSFDRSVSKKQTSFFLQSRHFPDQPRKLLAYFWKCCFGATGVDFIFVGGSYRPQR